MTLSPSSSLPKLVLPPMRPSSVIAKLPSSTVAEQPSSTVAEQPSSTVAEQPSSTVAEQPSSTVAQQPSFLSEQQLANIFGQPSSTIAEQPSFPPESQSAAISGQASSGFAGLPGVPPIPPTIHAEHPYILGQYPINPNTNSSENNLQCVHVYLPYNRQLFLVPNPLSMDNNPEIAWVKFPPPRSNNDIMFLLGQLAGAQGITQPLDMPNVSAEDTNNTANTLCGTKRSRNTEQSNQMRKKRNTTATEDDDECSNPDYQVGESSTSGTARPKKRKSKADKPKRLPNSFICFRNKLLEKAQEADSEFFPEQKHVSKVVSKYWQKYTEEQKDKFHSVTGDPEEQEILLAAVPLQDVNNEIKELMPVKPNKGKRQRDMSDVQSPRKRRNIDQSSPSTLSTTPTEVTAITSPTNTAYPQQLSSQPNTHAQTSAIATNALPSQGSSSGELQYMQMPASSLLQADHLLLNSDQQLSSNGHHSSALTDISAAAGPQQDIGCPTNNNIQNTDNIDLRCFRELAQLLSMNSDQATSTNQPIHTEDTWPGTEGLDALKIPSLDNPVNPVKQEQEGSQ